jgi:hypothetical protein
MGFASLGCLQVLLKPLRPFGLLSRYRNISALQTVAPILDAPFCLASALAAPGDPATEILPAGEGDLEAVHKGLALHAQGRIGQHWNPGAWSRRFRQTLEGEPYVILSTGDPGAGLLLTMAHRKREGDSDHPIKLCVILDLWAKPGDLGSPRKLLRNAEAQARRKGCHALIWLDGVPELTGLFKSLGYRTTPETYQLLAWPKARVAGAWAGELGHWRFPMAEHDAF